MELLFWLSSGGTWQCAVNAFPKQSLRYPKRMLSLWYSLNRTRWWVTSKSNPCPRGLQIQRKVHRTHEHMLALVIAWAKLFYGIEISAVWGFSRVVFPHLWPKLKRMPSKAMRTPIPRTALEARSTTRKDRWRESLSEKRGPFYLSNLRRSYRDNALAWRRSWLGRERV
jgi:hypothetical protein